MIPSSAQRSLPTLNGALGSLSATLSPPQQLWNMLPSPSGAGGRPLPTCLSYTLPAIRGTDVAQHPFVATQFFCVPSGTAEDFTPPNGHMTTVVLVDPTRKERREQLVLLHPVVEGIDHPGKGVAPSSPFIERRRGCHSGRIVGNPDCPLPPGEWQVSIGAMPLQQRPAVCLRGL